MLNTSKTINISGYSQVNESSKPYVYFSASIDKTGTTSVNYSIQDKEIFNANQDIFKTKKKTFKNKEKKIAN